MFPTAEIEEATDTGFAKVGIHEHGAISQLRKRDRQVRRGRLLGG